MIDEKKMPPISNINYKQGRKKKNKRHTLKSTERTIQILSQKYISFHTNWSVSQQCRNIQDLSSTSSKKKRAQLATISACQNCYMQNGIFFLKKSQPLVPGLFLFARYYWKFDLLSSMHVHTHACTHTHTCFFLIKLYKL